MKNNKGQVLVAFLLLLPIVFFIAAIVLDFGQIALEKRKVNNTLNEVLEYANTHKEDEKLESSIKLLIQENIKNIDVLEIQLSNEKINIHIVKKVDGSFKNILDKDLYQIEEVKEISFE